MSYQECLSNDSVYNSECRWWNDLAEVILRQRIKPLYEYIKQQPTGDESGKRSPRYQGLEAARFRLRFAQSVEKTDIDEIASLLKARPFDYGILDGLVDSMNNSWPKEKARCLLIELQKRLKQEGAIQNAFLFLFYLELREKMKYRFFCT